MHSIQIIDVFSQLPFRQDRAILVKKALENSARKDSHYFTWVAQTT
jgi:hypothetical protein